MERQQKSASWERRESGVGTGFTLRRESEKVDVVLCGVGVVRQTLREASSEIRSRRTHQDD